MKKVLHAVVAAVVVPKENEGAEVAGAPKVRVGATVVVTGALAAVKEKPPKALGALVVAIVEAVPRGKPVFGALDGIPVFGTPNGKVDAVVVVAAPRVKPGALAGAPNVRPNAGVFAAGNITNNTTDFNSYYIVNTYVLYWLLYFYRLPQN